MKQTPKTIRDFVRRAAMTLAVMLMIATAAWADSAFSGGAGTTGNPYQIATAADLVQLSADVRGGNGYGGKYFLLTSAIDMSGVNFTPIGYKQSAEPVSFDGTLNGAGHTISHLSIDRGSDGYNLGLFSKLNGAVKFVGYYDAFGIDQNDEDIYYMTAENTLKHTVIRGTPRSA